MLRPHWCPSLSETNQTIVNKLRRGLNSCSSKLLTTCGICNPIVHYSNSWGKSKGRQQRTAPLELLMICNIALLSHMRDILGIEQEDSCTTQIWFRSRGIWVPWFLQSCMDMKVYGVYKYLYGTWHGHQPSTTPVKEEGLNFRPHLSDLN